MDDPAADSSPSAAACLDLRGTPCPLNYVRSLLALERLAPGDWLQVDLDAGEPEQMVADGLRAKGHAVLVEALAAEGTGPAPVRLRVCRAA